MKKTLYATIQTCEGELLTFGTAPFATRQACVESLCGIYRKDLENGEFFEMDDSETEIEDKVAEMRKKLDEKDVFVDDVTEYAVVEVEIDEAEFAAAEPTKDAA